VPKDKRYGSQNSPDAYICSRALKEAHMLTSRTRQEPTAWSIGSSLVTLGLPPKDPDDDDEDEEDDEDEDEEEPAVVREPDENE
jgi:hypothetical protein